MVDPDIENIINLRLKNKRLKNKRLKNMLKQATTSIMKIVLIFISTMFIVSSLQWGAVQIYASQCIRSGFWGLLTNPITLGSPFCQFTNHVQIALADYYITIWASAAASSITWLTATSKCKKNTQERKLMANTKMVRGNTMENKEH